VRMMAGPAAELFTRSLRISNRRFREATGWAPRVPNAIEGMTRIGAENPPVPTVRVPLAVRFGLWAMALFILVAGIQQQFAPRAFYDSFPGFGMHWVSVDGSYNEHLVRDLGGANVALGTVILFAIARPTAGLVRAIAAAVLVAQVPHFIYHAAHLDLLPTMLDRVLQTAALASTLAIPLLVLLRSGRIRQEPESSLARAAESGVRRAEQQPQRLATSTR
jgi:hypothetical protein